ADPAARDGHLRVRPSRRRLRVRAGPAEGRQAAPARPVPPRHRLTPRPGDQRVTSVTPARWTDMRRLLAVLLALAVALPVGLLSPPTSAASRTWNARHTTQR